MKLNDVSELRRVVASERAMGAVRTLADQFGLAAGELAAIAVLKEHGGDFLLSDDTAARATAEALGFQVRGTVGLILRGWKREQLSKAAARDLLRSLPQRSTLHLRSGFLHQVLLQLDN